MHIVLSFYERYDGADLGGGEGSWGLGVRALRPFWGTSKTS